jgi:hypothetical protein
MRPDASLRLAVARARPRRLSARRTDRGAARACAGDRRWPRGGTPAVDAAPPPITADECGAYVDHVLAVALGAMRGTRAADEIPTSEQVATIRAKLVASAPCRELDRAAWTCAMAAVDQAALYACAGPTASAAGAPASDAR